MINRMQFYIDGAWVDPAVKKSTPVVNPATEEAMYEVALGSKADVDKAVAAAKRAFVTFSQTSRDERVALLTKVIEIYKGRLKEIGAAVSDEMGAPLPRDCGIVTVIDGHPAALGWLGSVRGHRVEALGVEQFGQTGTIADLYRHHGIDANAIIDAAESLTTGAPVLHRKMAV